MMVLVVWGGGGQWTAQTRWDQSRWLLPHQRNQVICTFSPPQKRWYWIGRSWTARNGRHGCAEYGAMEYLRFRYIFSKLAELVKWQKNDFTNYILRKALVNQRFICSMANWDWIGLFMVSENVTGTVCWHLRKWMKFFPKSVKHLANVVCMSCCWDQFESWHWHVWSSELPLCKHCHWWFISI